MHFEIKGLCASAQPGVAFRRLCSQSVVLEGVGWGGGSLSLAYSQTFHLGTWVDLVLDDIVDVVHNWINDARFPALFQP